MVYVFLVHVLFSLSLLSHSPGNGVRILYVFVYITSRAWSLSLITSHLWNNIKKSFAVLTLGFIVSGIVMCVLARPYWPLLVQT